MKSLNYENLARELQNRCKIRWRYKQNYVERLAKEDYYGKREACNIRWPLLLPIFLLLFSTKACTQEQNSSSRNNLQLFIIQCDGFLGRYIRTVVNNKSAPATRAAYHLRKLHKFELHKLDTSFPKTHIFRAGRSKWRGKRERSIHANDKCLTHYDITTDLLMDDFVMPQRSPMRRVAIGARG